MKKKVRSIFQLLKAYRIDYKLRRKPVALLYHHLSEEDKSSFAKFHTVQTSVLKKQIAGVAKRKQIVFDSTFLSHCKNDYRSGYACLTFDDGYKEAIQNLVPILEELKVPATFYVNSSFVMGEDFWRGRIRFLIDDNKVEEFLNSCGLMGILTVENFYNDSKNPNLISSKLLKQHLDVFFKKKGLQINNKIPFAGLEDLKTINECEYLKVGNHTASHMMLSTLTKEEQYKEIEECQIFLEKNFNKEKISKVFSMPFGGYHTFNKETLDCLRELDFEGAFISEAGHYLSKTKLMDIDDHGFSTYKRFLPKKYMRFN